MVDGGGWWWWMVVVDGGGGGGRKKISLISLKLCTLKVHDKCEKFSIFRILLKQMWKEIRFKFEISEKFYREFPWKKKMSLRIPCKMNPDHI